MKNTPPANHETSNRGLAKNMLKMEEIFTIRKPHDDGLSIREIRRQRDHSRKTISKYLGRLAPQVYKSRPSKPGKLDPYKEYIYSRLKEYPLSVVRLFEEIQEQRIQGRLFPNQKTRPLGVIPFDAEQYTMMRHVRTQ